jgi:hypothetical protein
MVVLVSCESPPIIGSMISLFLIPEVYSEDEVQGNLLVSVKNDMLSEEVLKYFCVNCGLNYESEEQLTVSKVFFYIFKSMQ